MTDEWDWFDSLPGDAQEEVNGLRNIAAKVAGTKWVRYVDGAWGCPFECAASMPWGKGMVEWQHAADCPVTQARKLVAGNDRE